LPSTMRLPRMRGGSTASSLNLNIPPQTTSGAFSAAATITSMLPPVASSVSQSRLSVENIDSGCLTSVASSNGLSLRPVSMASSNSRLSTGLSVVSSGSATSMK
jgi:hypothetical protein